MGQQRRPTYDSIEGGPKGVYVISVAARLVEMHPQTLRLYERAGLVKPARTANNIRLYSDEDIERLRQIQRLTRVGLNLAGVEMVLELLERMDAMRRELEEEMARRLTRPAASSAEPAVGLEREIE